MNERIRQVLNVVLVCLMVGLAITLAGTCTGCSAGPQLPITTTPITISVTYNAQDGGAIEDSDVLIDRSSAASDAQTTGNEIRDNTISPSVDANVSAIP